MSEQDVATAPSGAVDKPAWTGLLLAPATLLWMAAMLWSARATITGRVDAEMEVTSTAYALPGAISASLVTGAAVGVTVLGLITRRRALGASARFAVATGTGLLIGLLGAISIITINTDGWLYAVVGGTVAAAATIGGAIAGFRAPRVVAAVCWAAVGVFVVGFLLNLFQNPVLDAFGSGDTRSSQAGAAQWFAFCQSLLSGLTAGLISYAVLRRAHRDGPALPWPMYALAGAGPGLLLVIAEGLTRTAGARVLDLAGKVSELELTVQQMLSGARFNNALIVLFVGAITAVIAIGRTMSPAVDPPADLPEDPPATDPGEGDAPAASVAASAAADSPADGSWATASPAAESPAALSRAAMSRSAGARAHASPAAVSPAEQSPDDASPEDASAAGGDAPAAG
jgi:iron complex transport system permease protein